MVDWSRAIHEIPSLEEGDVVEVLHPVFRSSQNDIKEVDHIEESPEGSWKRRIHFRDGSLIRKSMSDKWGFKNVNGTIRPVLGVTPLSEEEIAILNEEPVGELPTHLPQDNA